jgi:hypothetical protein
MRSRRVYSRDRNDIPHVTGIRFPDRKITTMPLFLRFHIKRPAHLLILLRLRQSSTMSPKSTLILHHLNNSRSQRILWLLEELNLPYTIKKYTRLPNQRAPPELLAVNPLGKSPVITDGDVNIAESGAIIGAGCCMPFYWLN